MIAAGFSWFHLIEGIDHDTTFASICVPAPEVLGGPSSCLNEGSFVYLHAWLACFVVIGFAILARMGLERARKRGGIEAYYADSTFSMRNMAEVVITGLSGFMEDLLSARDVRAFMPLIGGLFLYIVTCNLMGLVPGFQPPTAWINTNVGMAAVVFIVFNYVGLSRDARGYISHLMGPVLFLIPLLFPIELISLVARPVALTVRLTANLFGDHAVFVIMSDLASWASPLIAPPLMILATMVSVIQAFVFSLLTVIYINLSLPHHEHSEAH